MPVENPIYAGKPPQQLLYQGVNNGIIVRTEAIARMGQVGQYLYSLSRKPGFHGLRIAVKGAIRPLSSSNAYRRFSTCPAVWISTKSAVLRPFSSGSAGQASTWQLPSCHPPDQESETSIWAG